MRASMISIVSFLMILLSLASMTASADNLSGAEDQDCFGPEVMTPLTQIYGPLARTSNGKVCKADDHNGYRLVQILDTIRNLTFDGSNEASGDDFSTPRVGSNWTNYIHEKAKGINLDIFHCQEGVAAEGNFRTGIIRICPFFLDTSKVDIIGAIHGLMHEATHLRNQVPHVRCLNPGTFQGSSALACDDALADGGGYSVATEVLAKLAVSVTNISPVLKSQARAEAVLYALTRFNKRPFFKQISRPYLLTQKGDLGVYADGAFSPLQSEVPTGQLAPGYEGDFYFVPNGPDDTTKHFWSGRQFIVLNNTHAAIDALTTLNGNETQVRGLHLGARMQVLLRRDNIEVLCLSQEPGATFARNGVRTNLAFRGNDFVSLEYAEGFDVNQKSVTVRNGNKNWFDISCDAQGNAVESEVRKGLPEFRKIMKIGNNYFGMNDAGQFGQLVAKNKQAHLQVLISARIVDFTEMTDYVYLRDGVQDDSGDIATEIIH